MGVCDTLGRNAGIPAEISHYSAIGGARELTGAGTAVPTVIPALFDVRVVIAVPITDEYQRCTRLLALGVLFENLGVRRRITRNGCPPAFLEHSRILAEMPSVCPAHLPAIVFASTDAAVPAVVLTFRDVVFDVTESIANDKWIAPGLKAA